MGVVMRTQLLFNLFPLVSNLVEVYMTGISSLSRAIIYFTFIVYFSYNDYDQSSQSPSLMANAKNPLNLYFVKYAWGWTFTAVFLFMLLSNYLTSGTWISERTVKSSCRLAVGTLVWYVLFLSISPRKIAINKDISGQDSIHLATVFYCHGTICSWLRSLIYSSSTKTSYEEMI